MWPMKIPFSTEQMQALRSSVAQQVDIQLVAETTSTNTDLLGMLAPNLRPTLLIAQKQTAGRGRSGRVWHSAEDGSLIFSLAWKFRCPINRLVGLPLAVGVALADALAVYDVFVQLKWPNDVFKDGKKLAGILIETAVHADGDDATREVVWAVIGVGLNLVAPEKLEAEVGQPIADAPWLAQANRNELMATILNSLVSTLVSFELTGFAPFASRWNRLHAFEGKPVCINDRGQTIYEGIAIGVDASGCLLLNTQSGIVAVRAGDVSLRGAEGQ